MNELINEHFIYPTEIESYFNFFELRRKYSAFLRGKKIQFIKIFFLSFGKSIIVGGTLHGRHYKLRCKCKISLFNQSDV